MSTKNPLDGLIKANIPYGSIPSDSNPVLANDDSRLPTQDENDALAGTAGAPSAANKFVTDTDKRLVSVVADPGGANAAIPVTRSASIALAIAAGQAETNTLAVPTFQGQRLSIFADAVGAAGTRAITASQAVNAAGNTVLTFDAARDHIVLEAITVGTALRWNVVANAGVTLA